MLTHYHPLTHTRFAIMRTHSSDQGETEIGISNVWADAVLFIEADRRNLMRRFTTTPILISTLYQNGRKIEWRFEAQGSAPFTVTWRLVEQIDPEVFGR